MECNKSHDDVPIAAFVGGQCIVVLVVVVVAEWFVVEVPCCECLRALERADMVSSQAGRSQSSKSTIFLALVNPLEGRDFLNLSKLSIGQNIVVCAG